VRPGRPARDYINIATAGPIASANCGSGYDKIRFNRRERKHVHACEKRHMLNDSRAQDHYFTRHPREGCLGVRERSFADA
jgi:hypothetical protein